MTRTQKIEALAEEYLRINKGSFLPEREMYIAHAFKAGILAGIALRDEELLALKFDEAKVIEDAIIDADAFEAGARWQYEQFMKAIKGDG